MNQIENRISGDTTTRPTGGVETGTGEMQECEKMDDSDTVETSTSDRQKNKPAETENSLSAEMSESGEMVSSKRLEKNSTEMDNRCKTDSCEMMSTVAGECMDLSKETLNTERLYEQSSIAESRTLNQPFIRKDKTLVNTNAEVRQKISTEEERGVLEEYKITSHRKCSKKDLVQSLNLLPRERVQGDNPEEESSALEPCAKAELQTVNLGSAKNRVISQGCDEEETQKENYERTQKQKTLDSGREQTKRNHRKSASPNHFSDNRRMGRALQWFRHKDVFQDKEQTFSEDAEVLGYDAGKVASQDEDLLEFAEILYKCALCTTLPCILTSQSAFLRHVREHHLATQTPGNRCSQCGLHFQTHTDLLAHLTEAHSHSEKENCAINKDFSSQHLDHEISKPPSCGGSRSDKEKLGEPIKMDVESDDENLDQPVEDQKDSQQQTENDTEASMTSQANLSSRPTSSTPLATLEYHSSTQHLSRQPMPPTGSGSPPQHVQQADASRSPLFNSTLEGLNGFPSFTPEFGRYTKLIREGGRIVYFCQVCNTKCQVKAAFQAHCNGIRHHNTVNMAGKSKSHGTSPLSSRDASLRPPLKEVAVMGPQLVPPRGDSSPFMEKMAKLFQDHPDLSTVLNQGKHLVLNDFWGSPVNFSMKDRSVADADGKESKPSIKDIRFPEKGNFFDRNLSAESRTVSPHFQRQYNHRMQSDDHCIGGALRKSDNEKTSAWSVSENSDNYFCDAVRAGSRKRAAPSADSPTLSENESVPLSRVSSVTCVTSTDNSLCRDRKDADSSVIDHDSIPEHSNSKRPRMDTQQRCDIQNTSETGCSKESSRTDCDHTTQQSRLSDYHNQHLQQRIRGEEGCSDGDDKHAGLHTSSDDLDSTSGDSPHLLAHSSSSNTRNQSVSESSDSVSSRTSSAQGHDQSVSGMQFLDVKQQYAFDSSDVSRDIKQQSRSDSLSAPGVLPMDIKQQPRTGSPSGTGPSLGPDQHALFGMLAKHRFPMDTAGCFIPSLVSDAWLRQEGVREMEQPAWGSMGLSVHEQDDVTDGGKGQNSEGWKVTQIRDVLRGLITASSKGSSVSRDALLHRVSLVLQSADVQHWGPACNRAVRDLFPHCLAQRKGKFKKTYFFGLSLIPGPEETKGGDLVHVDGTSFRPLRDMTQDLEQLLEHLPGLLYWSGEMEHGVSRDAVLHVLAARLSEDEVFHWGMQCNKALRMLHPLVLMKRKGKYKTVYYGVDFTSTAKKLLPTLGSARGQTPWQELGGNITC